MRLHDQRERKLVDYGNAPADYKTDVDTRQGGRHHRAPAADPRPFFLYVAYLAPHGGGPRDPDDPAGSATPSPAPRHRNHFATAAADPPSFNEADVSDKPAGDPEPCPG